MVLFGFCLIVSNFLIDEYQVIKMLPNFALGFFLCGVMNNLISRRIDGGGNAIFK